ncbi:50S ribosomal protein L44e [Methanogenium organophilum]|uniref:Large ribosomal subunit protein eL42 n=1 Tax=Methanogenium organophilum TaxID=2199 RepID=A0A9X9T840_METOG|nr:50S ribosomal protein L44e [Methanogenium organophilum]WAI00777.1 50S ribosomal protein L44e [Methanogenium organophilum]
MKMPTKFKTYCPYCRKHETHEVERVKRGKDMHLHWIDRQKDRRGKVGNRGKFSKVPGGDKPTKRINVRYRCTVCGKAHLRRGVKAGKFELVE